MVRRAEHLQELMSAGDLPETAERILAAAKRILARHGWRGLTNAAIAAEADVYEPAINYYFGGRKGLVVMVFESIMRDAMVAMEESLMELPPGTDRVDATAEVLAALTDMLVPDGYAAFFETFPHLLRDRRAREVTLERCATHEDVIIRALTNRDDPETLERLRPHAILFIAVLDGLAIRKLLDPDNELFNEAAELFSAFMKTALADIGVGVSGRS